MQDAEIEGVVGELAGRVGRSFGSVWQPVRERVVLGLSDGTLILMVPRGPHARLHTIDERPKNPQRPFSFQGACRAHLRGPLTSVSRVSNERVVNLAFGATRLELRLTGRSGGLWLIEGERVLAAFDGPADRALPPLPERPEHAPSPARFSPGARGWNEAARRFFEAREQASTNSDRRARVEQSLRRELARKQRLLEELEGDLAKAERAPELRKKADLLAANLHRARAGDTTVIAEDWETGEHVTIALESGQTAAKTMDLLYGRAKRLERAAAHVELRLVTVRGEVSEHVDRLAGLPTVDDRALIKLDQGLPQRKRGAPREAPTVPWVTWTGPHGERVLIGRNAAGNRRLLCQVARGHDTWMHLRDAPGAHVLLPLPKGTSAPLPLLLAGAQLVLLAARLEPGTAADVQYAHARDVKAIPGEIGRVTVANEGVLHVTRDPAALTGWSPESVTKESG